MEGVYLLKIRTTSNDGDQFRMDDPYGHDSTNDEYLKSFLWGRRKTGSLTSKPEEAATPGYRYVEAIDPADGKRYRYTGSVKVVIELGVGRGLMVTVKGTDMAIHLEDFDPVDPYAANGVETFEFAGGVILSRAQLIDTLGFRITGSSLRDYLSGTSLGDLISGGQGKDRLDGGSGNDSYFYQAGDEHDLIVDQAGEDRLVFGSGVEATAVDVSLDANELVLTLSMWDSVRLALSPDGGDPVERIEFADGSIWNTIDLMREFFSEAPVATGLIAGMAVESGQAFLYRLPAGMFLDADLSAGDALRYSALLSNGAALPAWLSFDPATLTLSGVPGVGDTGVLSISVTATDRGGQSASHQFDLDVYRVNNAPVPMTTPSDQTVFEGVPFALSMPGNLFVDPDAGDVLVYSTSLADGSALPGWLSFDPATLAFSGVPGEGETGNWSIVVTATDIAGATASTGFSMSVVLPPPVHLVGTSGADTLTGFSGADTLDGGAGADRLIGRGGNDTYVVDNAGDVVVEAAGEGIDTVLSRVTLTLGANLENLALTGTSAISGTGNSLNNVLTGNGAANTLTGAAGDDTLDGGAGADRLVGGTGNDVYYVERSTDVVVESANAGTDTVNSTLTWTLGSNLEHLNLLGSGAISGTGNTLANALTGNAGANTLSGAAGNDTLNGGAGNDRLTGGTGNDTYVLGRGYGVDTVVENDATAGNADLAQFSAGIAADQLWFRRVGSNLEASIIGTGDQLILQGWYTGTAYHVEQFKTADNRLLLDSRVDNLVQAMAAFAPPAAGQTTLPQNYQDALATVIAANWQ